MYAVVENGGKQYRVEPGRTLVVDRIDAEAGATVTFDRVLLIADDDAVTVGTPVVGGASVRGTVVEHGRGPKIIVFRFRPKAHYRRRTGHRSALTRIRIDEIETPGGTHRAEPAEKPARAPRARKAASTKAESAEATAAPKPRARSKPAAEKPSSAASTSAATKKKEA